MKIRIVLLMTVMLLSMLLSVPAQASEVNSVAAQAQDGYSISGKVMLANGEPFSGVTMTLIDQSYMVFLPLVVQHASSAADQPNGMRTDSGAAVLDGAATRTTVTDANGEYRFDGVPEGRYRITPTSHGASFDPLRRTVVVAPDQTDQNFIHTDVKLVTSGGTFTMGCVPDHNGGKSCSGDDLPAHTVTLSKFYIDKLEVTNFQYQQCVDAGYCEAPLSDQSKTVEWYYGNKGYDNYPVINVSWYDAQDYCSWAGKRLPTEAEWEMAARGSSPRAYPWGDAPPNCSFANYYSAEGFCSNNPGDLGDTMPVGSYLPGASPCGALDMAGNVKEWVMDWYDQSYYKNSPIMNPSGPSVGDQKGVRGGSFDSINQYILTSTRHALEPNYKDKRIGFRCVVR